MIAYQTNGKWVVKVSGGYRNRDVIPSRVIEVPEKPEPVATWRDSVEDGYGWGYSTYVQFRAGDVTFVIQSYHWDAAPGYSWEESWEDFAEDAQPPVIGEAFEWTGSGWEPIEHPMSAEGVSQ
ncbi:hypothetical protein [Kyrpidia tusciae]|uniref:Uncharacterized protein n=1 Tax=Kyrpidia tusciae (strain DSM 2912 / NBRC 15312 / T2) TaxID=562970 RepID=D5WQN4_KYRT2|nr:hypothetical protein [Kyrpidia tusciae]ADG06643.1 hypothetical protein Btus_1948 [Kyrpidia tusciae DSM 2912]